jgi:DNA-binding response OmpR family regulator
MVAEILIVGDDPMLLQTRADLLNGWQVSTATTKQGIHTVHSAAYDLVIICQTVSDAAAGQLIDEARKMNPNVLALAISQPGHERNLNVELFEVQLMDPDRLRRVVTHLLQQADSGKRLT